jgi:outer membrane receptor protein involved in Fe transport
MATLLVLFLLQASPANGQSISGVVLDSSDIPVPAIAVVLHQGKSNRSAQTSITGEFRFDRLAPGDYEVRVALDGFRPAIVPLKLRNTPFKPLVVKLALADVSTQVNVEEQSGKVNVDAADNLNAVSVQREALDNLPALGQDYIGTLSRFLDPGVVGTGGVTLVVDGVEATKAGVSASAIQEIKINNNPFSAEFSRPGRGRIEIITKPGSDAYHGTGNFVFRDQHLNARDAFAATRPPEQRRIYEGSLLGPLLNRKTTSFLITANREENDLQAVIYAHNLLGPIQDIVPTPGRQTEFSGKITHQFNDKHAVFWQYTYENREMQNQGVGGFVLQEAGTNFSRTEQQFVFNHRWIITPKLLSQFRILFGYDNQNTVSINNAPRLVVQDSFTRGGAQADLLRTEAHTAYNWIVTYSAGKHTIKTGMNVPDISRRGLSDRGNQLGTYSFSTLADYSALRPFSLLLQQGPPRTVFWEKVLGGFVQDEWMARPNLTLSMGLRYDWQNYFHDANNLSPRFGVVYAPGKSRKVVIRGGAGFFYDRTGPAVIWDLLRFDGAHLNRYLISNPVFPQPPVDSSTPTGITRLDPSVRIPYTVQYSISIERQLNKGTTLAAAYVANRGVSLLRSRDANAPQAPLYLFRPDASLNAFRQIESAGGMRSDSLEITLRGRLSKYFSGLAQYNFGHSYNNTGGLAYFPANSNDWSREWGRSDFDKRHQLNILGTFTLAKWFNLGVAVQAQSGGPYSQTTGRDENRDGLAIDRPAGVGRNTLQGPGYLGLDLRWARDFALTHKKEKGLVATVAFDAFNVLNRVNYTGFVGNLSSPFYGQPVASQPARRGQISLRLRF